MHSDSTTSHAYDVASAHLKFPVGYFLRTSLISAYFQTKIFQNLNICTKYTKKELSWGKFPAYNSSSVERKLFPAMKLHALRSVAAFALAALLAACGGGQIDQPTQTAAVVSSSQAGSAASVASVASAAMPAPDCAADGCKSLRIIDGNAEAYRYEAMRRAAADEAAGNTNT
jgi:hypothetical protein